MARSMPDDSTTTAGVNSLDELCERLRDLRARAGSPSYTEIARGVAGLRAARGVPERERKPGRITVYDCFKPGRSRLDVELLVEIAEVLGAEEPGWWRQTYSSVSGESSSATIVSAADRLPAELFEFSGRHGELTDIVAAASPALQGRALVVAVEGMAGVGKTLLAIRAGHELRRTFDDLQLFVNLRGYDPDEAPVDPRAVLGSFLRMLGVRGDQFQHLDLEDRAGLYRRMLRARRAVIVLDNAADEDQVRPLLPDSPTCAVVITSRRQLSGLGSALHVALGVFSQEEALDYLRRVVGAERIDAEPEAVRELIELCGYLPLGLALTAAELQRKPNWSLADHVRRLVSFPRDDSVRSVLAASYRSLASPVQRFFRLLSLHPGVHGVEPATAAALTSVRPEIAEGLLRQLLAEHLLQSSSPGRYQFHDLVRAYAERLVRLEDPHCEHQAALTQLLDYYVHTASIAMDLVAPHDRERRPRIHDSIDSVAPFADREGATGWLDAERTNLVSAGVCAAGHGLSSHTYHLSAILHRYLDTGAHYHDAEILYIHALQQLTDPTAQSQTLSRLGGVCFRMERFTEALEYLTRGLAIARENGDQHIECGLLATLGIVFDSLGRYPEALEYQQASLTLARRLGDQVREGIALGNLACVYLRTGPWAETLEHLRQDLAIARYLGDRAHESQVLGNLGDIYEKLGRFEEALDHLRAGITLAREIGTPLAEANAMGNMGVVFRRMGRLQEALEQSRHALDLVSQIGDRHLEGHILENLGLTFLRLGDHAAALSHQHRALALARRAVDKPLEIAVLNSMGEILRTSGSAVDALEHHRHALETAHDTGDRPEQARAHDGIAHVTAGQGDHGTADTNWRQALAIYAELGAPEAEEIRSHLARFRAPQPATAT